MDATKLHYKYGECKVWSNVKPTSCVSRSLEYSLESAQMDTHNLLLLEKRDSTHTLQRLHILFHSTTGACNAWEQTIPVALLGR